MQPCTDVRVVEFGPIILTGVLLNSRGKSDLVQGNIDGIKSSTSAFFVFFGDSVVRDGRVGSELCELCGVAGSNLCRAGLISDTSTKYCEQSDKPGRAHVASRATPRAKTRYRRKPRQQQQRVQVRKP